MKKFNHKKGGHSIREGHSNRPFYFSIIKGAILLETAIQIETAILREFTVVSILFFDHGFDHQYYICSNIKPGDFNVEMAGNSAGEIWFWALVIIGAWAWGVYWADSKK